MSTACPVHNVPWKTIPAGVSKTTNRPYNAFQVCPVQGCQAKPPKQAFADTMQPSFQESVVLGRIEAKLDAIISILRPAVQPTQTNDKIQPVPTQAVYPKQDDINPSDIPF